MMLAHKGLLQQERKTNLIVCKTYIGLFWSNTEKNLATMQLITTKSLTFATHIRFEKIKKRIQVYLFFDKQVV